MINSSKIDKNYLIGNFITEFDNEYNVIQNIKSDKIDVSQKKWIIFDAKVYERNNYSTFEKFSLKPSSANSTLIENLSLRYTTMLFNLCPNFISIDWDS